MTFTTVEIRNAVKDACDEFFNGKMAEHMYFELMGKIEKNLEYIAYSKEMKKRDADPLG